jgi:hypothetical protein
MEGNAFVRKGAMPLRGMDGGSGLSIVFLLD